MEAWERSVAKEYREAIHKIAAYLESRHAPEPQDADWALATRANLADARTRAEQTLRDFDREPRKPQSPEPSPPTNMDRVYDVLAFTVGIDRTTICDRTGLDNRQVSSALQKLHHKGKVKPARHSNTTLWKKT